MMQPSAEQEFALKSTFAWSSGWTSLSVSSLRRRGVYQNRASITAQFVQILVTHAADARVISVRFDGRCARRAPRPSVAHKRAAA